MQTNNSLSIDTVRADTIYAGNFVGNGALITDIVVSEDSLPAVIKADLIGNVTANKVTADVVEVNGKNIGAQGSSCFVMPGSGIYGGGATPKDVVSYDKFAGWNIRLENNKEVSIYIRPYTCPINPDAPFEGLPKNISQRVVGHRGYSPERGNWEFDVYLKAHDLVEPIPPTPVTIGSYNFGTFMDSSCDIHIEAKL